MQPATVKKTLADAWQQQSRGELTEAEAVYRHVLEKVPESAQAWCYLGMVLNDRGEFVESESAYRRALELKPDFPAAWNNFGNTLRMIGKVDEADEAFATAISQRPGYMSAWKNRGTLWVYERELDRAVKTFYAGLCVEPDNAELHRNLGVVRLLQGRFEEGWREYKWRWKVNPMPRPPVPQPIWDGSDLNGKTILLYPEQGLGDTIQFVRFARVLKEQGATTIVQSKPRMIPLLTTCLGIDQLLPIGVARRSIDFHCSLIEVAERLNIDQSSIADSLPDERNYLSATVNLVEKWQNWLAPLSDQKKKIGICWQGNPDHQADAFRSIPLQSFSRIIPRDDTQFFSLQFGHGTEQLEQVSFRDHVQRLPDSVDRATDTFMDTAAILKCLDLVITSDTSVAHLAGALNVPVWVALPFVPDWRWGVEGSTTDWYPSMRLFRQPSRGDWDNVFDQFAAALDYGACQ